MLIDDNRIVWHRRPVWRSRGFYSFHVPVVTPDGNYDLEQLSGSLTFDRTMIVCCIPFFVNDLGLGDEVDVDNQGRFVKVIHDAGQHTYRISFDETDRSIRSHVKKIVTTKFDENDIPIEWWQRDLLAVSVSDDQSGEIGEFLEQERNAGRLKFNTGRTTPSTALPKPFEVPRLMTVLPPFVSSSEVGVSIDVGLCDVAQHSSPAWKERADFVFYTYIRNAQGTQMWEQFYGKRIDSNRAILCCIPFAVYDVQLGDEVEVDRDNTFVRTLHPGGQIAYGVSVKGDPKGFEAELRDFTGDTRVEVEWAAPCYCYVSVPLSFKTRLVRYLTAKQREKLLSYTTSTT